MRYPIYEMLTEGRDAPLYHATGYDKLRGIVDSNYLQAMTRQEINSKAVKGVSLTREFRFAKKWNDGVILQIDQRKLAQTYKIIPFDYWEKSSYRRKNLAHAEAEEFVPRQNLESL